MGSATLGPKQQSDEAILGGFGPQPKARRNSSLQWAPEWNRPGSRLSARHGTLNIEKYEILNLGCNQITYIWWLTGRRLSDKVAIIRPDPVRELVPTG